MRALLACTFIAFAASISIGGPASALSVLQTEEKQAPQAQVSPAPDDRAELEQIASYLEKPSLTDITEALRQNREHRQMFVGLAKRDTKAESVLTKYIKALDVRFAILSAVGDSLLKATTQEEVTEATLAAQTLLGVRSELDRAIGATQMAIIDAARPSDVSVRGCANNTEAAEGAKCGRIYEDGAPSTETPSSAPPRDASRFDAVPSADPKR
jgi:hypothetical protein